MGDGTDMPVAVPPAMPIPDRLFPLTPAPLTAVGKGEPGVVIDTIVEVKHGQTLTTRDTTRIELVPTLQHSMTCSIDGVTILTDGPVGVVGPIYGWVLFSDPVVFTGEGLPVDPGKASGGATGKVEGLSWDTLGVEWVVGGRVTGVVVMMPP